MLITYCQKCQLILTCDKLDSSDVCEDCAAGRTRRLTRSRHSDQISRKRLLALSRAETRADEDDLPKVIATPERDEIC